MSLIEDQLRKLVEQGGLSPHAFDDWKAQHRLTPGRFLKGAAATWGLPLGMAAAGGAFGGAGAADAGAGAEAAAGPDYPVLSGLPAAGADVTGNVASSGGLSLGKLGKLLQLALGGASIYSGAKSQSQANKLIQEQLAQMAEQRRLGKLLMQKGTVGNPFSGQYGAIR